MSETNSLTPLEIGEVDRFRVTESPWLYGRRFMVSFAELSRMYPPQWEPSEHWRPPLRNLRPPMPFNTLSAAVAWALFKP